mmetsp:Transcript_30747/g.78571  ORF Transcript_30747/g.78571 Transcript_30747/m.78571 type:complete len:367 (-) Transcript_30747:395-1495(-)|eukprot:CAMPEP_0202859084 /NCGR_PEP_ID=MMETSP1391-20130828/1356_1 /ASSEMBLY_ACC=CAM_ASM_000867 /TAXON_ID=1034604 /ORGANISM="Chlamydomonas leiostraca, Strain SAG 11-49" /LENGTH=366 /DNA_ID=CAMNT_0049538089 /DNA_START=104 /DNA_END=1204 /DNA_ORIENTATION=+
MEAVTATEGLIPVTSSKISVRSSSGSVASLSIHYEVHRFPGSGNDELQASSSSSTQRVVLIMGFAAPSNAWYTMMGQLRALHRKGGAGTLELLLLDNIGIGKSSCPADKTLYTTTAMAHDALEVMDHLGWKEPCHIVGFSMGGMIATKLAAAAPSRVRSLACVSVTGGGTEIIPRSWRGFKYGVRALAAKTLEERARSDLRFHFSKRTLKALVPELGVCVRDVLFAEYCEEAKRNGPQPEAGQKGQTHAVWTHAVTDADVKAIKSGGFPVWFLHGRHDLIATPKFAERLASRFSAPCVFVDGGHFIPRECGRECSALLLTLFAEAASPKVPVTLGLSLQVGAGRPAPPSPASLGDDNKALLKPTAA